VLATFLYEMKMAYVLWPRLIATLRDSDFLEKALGRQEGGMTNTDGALAALA
jgi:hypothetical protein